MQKVSLFLQSFRTLETWQTIIASTLIFYILAITLLRFDSIVSLVENLSLSQSTTSILAFYLNPLDSFTYFSLLIFLTTAILFGAQIVALRLYVEKRFFHKNQTVSLAGIISSLVGCLACCGSVLVAGLLGLLGTSVQSLPFAGQEISVFGLAISLGALIYTIHKIDVPMVCR